MLEICFGVPAVGGEHTSHKCTLTHMHAYKPTCKPSLPFENPARFL